MTQMQEDNFHNPYSGDAAPEPTGSNTMGLIGFIVSLVSFVTCGLLAPISLLISVIALFKKPRGFAIAGTVISLFVVITGVIGIVLIVMSLRKAGGIMQQGVVMATAHEQILDFYYSNNRPPDKAELAAAIDAEMAQLPSWVGGGGPVTFAYDYTFTVITAPTDYSYELAMPGMDGKLGTADDLKETGTLP